MNRNASLSSQPVFIIGAARSGTRLLRDLIALHPGIDKIPYDVNYIWRIGNERLPHDELSTGLLTASIRTTIHQKFRAYSTGAPFVIEKTVSNCLRVPFVERVFPGAKFIQLVRNGEDVVESAYRQWTAPPDWKYIIGKAMTFPIFDAFGYGVSYSRRLLAQVLGWDEARRSTWGPRYPGIDDDIKTRDIIEVCAIQWVRCVEKAASDLSALEEERSMTLNYENFVAEPIISLKRIALFLGIDPAPFDHCDSSKLVTKENVGGGARRLTESQRQQIGVYINKMMELLGYSDQPLIKHELTDM